MTALLAQAIETVQALDQDTQDRIAALILEELKAEKKWDTAFAASEDQLASLADEALAEFEAGKTLPM